MIGYDVITGPQNTKATKILCTITVTVLRISILAGTTECADKKDCKSQNQTVRFLITAVSGMESICRYGYSFLTIGRIVYTVKTRHQETKLQETAA